MENEPNDHFTKKEKPLFGLVDFFYIPVSLLIIATLIALLNPNDDKKNESQNKKIQDNTPVLTTTELALIDYSPSVSTQGIVQAISQSILSTEVSGKVTFLSSEFTIGNSLKKGAILLKLDPTPYEATLANAKLQLEREIALSKQAKQELEIVNELQGASDLALRIPQLKQARAALKQAQANLDKCTIYAPYNCEVISKNVNLGESLSLGHPMGEIFSNRDLEIVCEVSENDIKAFENIPQDQITANLTTLKTDTPNNSNKLQIKNISSFINPITRSLQVTLKNNYSAQQTKIGSYHQVSLSTKKAISQVYCAPRLAFYQNQLIGINDNNTITLYPVEIKQQNDSNIYFQLTSEAPPNQVASSKLAFVVEGMKVRIIEATK